MSKLLSDEAVQSLAILAVQHPEEFVVAACQIASDCYDKGVSEAQGKMAALRAHRDTLLAVIREIAEIAGDDSMDPVRLGNRMSEIEHEAKAAIAGCEPGLAKRTGGNV